MKHPFISQLLHNAMDGVDYDFRSAFLLRIVDGTQLRYLPMKKLHIKAQYDYMTFIVESGQCSVTGRVRFPIPVTNGQILSRVSSVMPSNRLSIT